MYYWATIDNVELWFVSDCRSGTTKAQRGAKLFLLGLDQETLGDILLPDREFSIIRGII
jgi:hypothetical protein